MNQKREGIIFTTVIVFLIIVFSFQNISIATIMAPCMEGYPTWPNCQSESGGGGNNAECGNGQIEAGEQCEGNNLGNYSCLLMGFLGGSISCNNCVISTNQCTGGLDFDTSFEATPNEIPSGTSTILRWSAPEADSCRGLGGIFSLARLGRRQTFDRLTANNRVNGHKNIHLGLFKSNRIWNMD